MRLLALFVPAISIVTAGAVASEKNETSVETMPPVVVKTMPRAADTEVDPSLKQIRVTFSKDMMTNQMWSWVQTSKDTFPEVAGDVRYLEDNRTCVLPVKLLPGKTYVIWINSGKYNSFRDLGNRPAVPYLLVFDTKKKESDDDGIEQKGPAIGKTLNRLLGAIETGDRDTFVVNATDQVKEGMTQQIIEVLNAQLGARLKEGYQVIYLCHLNQSDHLVHLWKCTFADSGDDVVFRLAIKDGEVAGFFLQ